MDAKQIADVLFALNKLSFKEQVYCPLDRAVDPHSFFADLDPAVFLNADPDPGGKMNADPDPA